METAVLQSRQKVLDAAGERVAGDIHVDWMTDLSLGCAGEFLFAFAFGGESKWCAT